MKKVMVGGVFSVLHPGHLFFLNRAKSLGDCLVVVVASDRTVMKRKGILLKTAKERKAAIEKEGVADRVIIGDSEDFFRVVGKEKPDIIALGYDQEPDDELMRKAKALGCKTVRINERFKEYSSSSFMKNKK
jgi:FAD synthetase